MTLVNKTLSEKPIDKIEETNRELSQYSSISNRTDDTLTEKRLSQRKDRLSQLQKRHRFPPSLLTSRAADFWKTLLPLRANCSCSSISLGNERSRLSFGVSFSDTTVGSSDDSVSPFNEVASPRTSGETLECTQQAFELLIARMVRLMNIFNEGKNLSSTHLFSDSNLEILSPLNRKSENTVDITVGNSLCRFSSIASLSNNSTNNYYERRWQSSSTFEITEQRNRIKNPFSQNSSEISKNVFTEEELIYLLRYKRSLISEYFQSKVDSKDLKNKSDTSSERRDLIYATQSDSRLQEHGLVRLVQFVRSRIKEEAEDVSEENTHTTHNLESKTDKFSIPKRRVTFSDPLAENSTSSSNSFSIENDEEVSSVESFTFAITNDAKKSCDDYPESEISLESRSSSDLNSAVSSKACIVDLSLNSLSSRADYPETKIIHSMNSMENKVARHEMTGEVSEIKVDVLSTIPVQKHRSIVAEDRPMKALRLTPPNSLTPRKSVENNVKVMNKKKESKSLKFLMKEALDCGTTHVPISNEVEEVGTRKADAGIRRVTFEGRSQHQNSEGRFEEMDSLYQVLDPAGDCSFIANENCTQICEPENESVVGKSNEISERFTPSSSDEFEISDSEYNCDPSIPPGKTVTFQDYCQTISDQSITRYDEEELIEPSLRSDDRPIPSSVDIGWFELAWKGCWEEKNGRNGEKQTVDSNQTEMMTKVAEFRIIEEQREEPGEFSSDQKPLGTPCSRQTSYYTTVEGAIKSANDSGSEYESNDFFTADRNGWEKDETEDIDISKACKPVSKFYDDLRSDKEVINFPNRGDLARELADVYERIRNPEIWRSEVQTLAKPDWWYTACNCDKYSCRKKPEPESDWLMRRLEELKSNSDVDYESDYYADSEFESDFEWTRNFSPLNRSLSEIDVRSSECRKKFGTTKKDKRNKNIFLDKVLSGRKLLFRGCRCRNNLPSTRHDLKPRELKLRHKSFRDPDEERSRKNLFSNLRAKIILDSETEDSDNFSPSIQPELSRDFNCRNEYVNKIKCRRFVKSLKSVGGGLGLIQKSNCCDRQFSSSELLHVAFQRSFNPAGVQTELLTRTVATSIFEEQNHCSVMDVCIDTNDLCPQKSIGTINRASDFILETKDGNSQTLKSFLDALNSVHREESSPERCPVLIRKETPSGSYSEEYRNSGQKLSNVIESLSAQINNASNNLVKLRFSEVETAPEGVVAVSPPIKKDNLKTVEYSGPCQRSIEESNQPARPTLKILSTISPNKSRVENPPENISNDKSYRISETSNCPICNSGIKKTAARYVLPACVVRGATPDQRINEKDPWNRVMERAKIQHRYEIRDTATSLKFQQTERNPFSINEFHSREESTAVTHPSLVGDNSAHDAINRIQDHPAAFNKISSPSWMQSRRRSFFPPVRSSTPFNFLLPDLPRKSSPKRIRKPQTTIASMSNRLLYIISEKAELIHQTSIKLSPAENFFTRMP